MDSPLGYLLLVGVALAVAFALALAAVVAGRRRTTSHAASEPTEGFGGLAEFAAAHGWQGPRDDLSLDAQEARSVASIVLPRHDEPCWPALVGACTGHYRGMGILVANTVVTSAGSPTSSTSPSSPPGDEIEVGLVVVSLPYLLPKQHSVHLAPAVASAISRRSDWTLEFSSGRLLCVRHAPFVTVADLARTLDGLADVVNAVPADLVARFTVVMPRLPDGRISDPHDAESLGDALEQMTAAQRAAFLDQMRGLRRSRRL